MSLSRRQLLSLAFVGPKAAEPAPIVVSVFLRGGADGLNLVVPHHDDDYYDLRPTLAIPRPDDESASANSRAIDLDGRFGLCPGLAPLLPAFGDGSLAIVHAVGSDDETRSHFEAQDRMEHAGASGHDPGSGWLARALKARNLDATPLQALALGTRRPECLRGAAAVAVMERLEEYGLADNRVGPGFTSALRALYRGPDENDALAEAGRRTLDIVDELPEPSTRERDPHAHDAYPEHPFGRRLRELAAAIKADIGVQAATIDFDGWDTHFFQAQVLPGLADQLGRGLAAFRSDLGERMREVIVVVMTEFGRRAYENTSIGTDHGRASVMLLLGGPVQGGRGGQVVTRWPGLTTGVLEGPGDLAVTIDFRDALADVVGAWGVDGSAVFPGHSRHRLGLLRG